MSKDIIRSIFIFEKTKNKNKTFSSAGVLKSLRFWRLRFSMENVVRRRNLSNFKKLNLPESSTPKSSTSTLFQTSKLTISTRKLRFKILPFKFLINRRRGKRLSFFLFKSEIDEKRRWGEFKGYKTNFKF